MSEDEKPPSAEELAEAAKLRDALADDPLVSALRAAWSPEPLDERAHAEMLDDLPTAEEIAAAAKLRDGLDRDELVGVLRSAHRPESLPEAEHRTILDRAVSGGKVISLERRRARVVVVTTTIVAIAAGILLWVNRPSADAAPLAIVRSTQPLFGEPFKTGETSARIDRIALARASDYRDNRFAKWGVR
jgi:hypothetical protein